MGRARCRRGSGDSPNRGGTVGAPVRTCGHVCCSNPRTRHTLSVCGCAAHAASHEPDDRRS
jgi:hypothetical protein